ncbi:MAG: hypothetical protein JWQ60_2302, partial [Pseudonocardia sp.]|nr:hypothetical protein [Pseudonocardia sp.]
MLQPQLVAQPSVPRSDIIWFLP